MGRPLFVATVLVAVQTLAGCATLGAGKNDLSWLRSRAVLVVAEGAGAAAPIVEKRTERALALAPVRIHPASADAELEGVLAAADERVAVAHGAAEERRIPWVLIRTETDARIQNARGGAVRWRTRLPGRDPDRVLAERLTAAVAGSRTILDPGSVRLASAKDLDALRALAVSGSWGEHRARLDVLEGTFPADPAVKVHVVLFGNGLESNPAALSVAREMNPDGESELLALALAARSAGNTSIALVAYEALVALYPARRGYRVGLADARMAVHGPAEAVAACRGGFEEEFEDPRDGTDPHDAPDALPYADLRFHLGWYLAQTGAFEPATMAYERAGAIYEAMGRPREHGDALNNAGVSLVEAARPSLAVTVFRRALRVRRALGAARKVATTRYNLGRALADSGRSVDALAAYQVAAEEYEAAGRPRDALETRVETLALHALQGRRTDLEEAATSLLEAIDADSLRPLPADVWYELGAGRMAFADHTGAVEAFSAAVDGYRAAGRRLETAQSMYSMATPHVALYQFGEAHADLVGALRLAVELGDTESIVAIRRQLTQVRELIRMRDGTPPAIPPDLEDWTAP